MKISNLIINEILKQASFNHYNGNSNCIELYKSPILNYHFGYMIEILEQNGFDVVVAEGRDIYILMLIK